jgi:hypothetical protein
MDNTLEKFKQSIGQLFRANRFKISIDSPLVNFKEEDWYLAKSANVGNKNIGEISIPWQGYHYKIASDTTFQNTTITFLNNVPKDGSPSLRDKFEIWLYIMSDDASSIKASHDEYKGSVTIEQLDGVGNSVKGYILKHAHPTDITDLDLSMDHVDSVMEFSVTFSFSYYDFWSNGNINLNNIEQQAKQAIDNVRRGNSTNRTSNAPASTSGNLA